MKIRTGFVSNSSSSSFCIIGTSNETYVNKIADAWGLEEKEDYTLTTTSNKVDVDRGYGSFAGSEAVTMYGRGLEEKFFVGMDAEPLLETMTIPKAKEHVRKHIRLKFKVDIPSSAMEFLFGEVSSE